MKMSRIVPFLRGFTDHIRDPNVFEQDGIYYMILGARKRSNMGAIRLYSGIFLWTHPVARGFLQELFAVTMPID